VAETTAVLDQRFDKILYTGNGNVGRVVLAAAAKTLTPCILELGGKSPVVVDDDVDIRVAARRIVWGKFVNCGQTCIAPDYVMCKKSTEPALVKEMTAALKEYFGEDAQKSPDYCRIINERHFKRIRGLMQDGRVVIGGRVDEKDKYIEPTVLSEVTMKSGIMKDEIFGPVLPIVNVEGIPDAIRIINSNDKPLALYVFSNNAQTCELVLSSTTSGGAIANDTLMHAGIAALPFGGVGGSGFGAYHGKHSFDVFSHHRAVMVKNLGMEAINRLRYPPYSSSKTKWIMRLMLESVHGPLHKVQRAAIRLAVFAAVAAFAYKAYTSGRFLPW